MVAIASLLIVVAISLLVTRVATIALVATGLSSEVARFQARSAFTGAGFTTSESESVTGHPVRRRIVMLLMLLGNAGFVVVVGSLAISFAGARGGSAGLRLAVLAGGLLALVGLARSAWVDRRLSALIRRFLAEHTDLETRDFVALLDLGGDYAVLELQVQRGDWVAGRTLRELDLREEGIAVLGIQRAGGGYVGAPSAATRIEAGDTLVVYGRGPQLSELDERPGGTEGQAAHERAAAEQRALSEAVER